jgi:hypothetical protein
VQHRLRGVEPDNLLRCVGAGCLQRELVAGEGVAADAEFRERDGPVDFAAVKAEIDAGRPVGARIRWSGGGGHFCVIYGYTAGLFGDNYFDIDDPIYGKSHLTVSDFSNQYQGTGTWTDTDFTKSHIDFMVILPMLVDQEILRHIWEQRPLLG